MLPGGNRMTRVSRRRLLTSGAAASVLAASGLPTRAQSPGGTLRLGLSGAGPADNWDARTHTDSFMIMAGHGCVFDCLTEISAAGELIGELAESWEASGDARVWTFTLRRDAYFHDGKRFGADDVIASLRLHVEDGARSGARHIVEAIERFEKLTEHQVRLTLRAPNADFPFLLSDFHLVMYPSDNISGAMESGIGTGLYKVDGFEPGRRLLASRVDGHYKDGRAGCFDSVELIAINDARARMDALLSRRVDAVNRVDFRVESQLQADRNTRIIETTGNQHLAFEMSGRPGRDGRTLQTALKHAIDREDIVRTLLRGHGSAAQDHPVGPANQYFDKSLGTCEFDPERARSLLAAAGLADMRLNLVVADSVFPGIEDAGHRFAESLAAAGLDLTVTRQSCAALPTGGGDATLTVSCFFGRPTEDWAFSALHAPLHDPARFNALLADARSEFDSSRRRELYREMQQIFAATAPLVVPVHADHVDAHSVALTHSGRVGNTFHMDGLRMIERWWFA